MKMILAIVQDQDVDGLLVRLAEDGLRATRISSTGGFLRSGNSTVLIGVEEKDVSRVLAAIRATCRTRKHVADIIPAPHLGPDGAITSYPIEVEVGGASVFVWDVARYTIPGQKGESA